MCVIKITKHQFAHTFGGAGFHNNDATMYHIVENEHFNQYICKCYRELSPGFMRTFSGFSDWTKESMDEFADYYEKNAKMDRHAHVSYSRHGKNTFFGRGNPAVLRGRC